MSLSKPTARPGKPTAKRGAESFFVDYAKEVGEEIQILGTWWKGGTPAERRRYWKATVVQYEKKHRFPTGNVREAVLLSCPEYEVANDEEREFWCQCTGTGNKTYAALKAAWEKKKKEMTVQQAAEELVVQFRQNNDGDDADDEASGDDKGASGQRPNYKSIVRSFFTQVKGPTACKSNDRSGGVSDKHVRFEMRCILPGGDRLPTVNQQSKLTSGVLPTKPTSTGKMADFLKKHYPKVHAEFIEGKSPYSRTRVVDGEVIRKLTLKESWQSCVAYVIACASELRPFRLGKGARMVDFLHTLDPGFDVPCRSTCNRIALALVEYNKEMMKTFIATVKSERMDGCVATTEDAWTDGKGKNHYSSMSISVIARVLDKETVDIHSLSADDIASGNFASDLGKKKLVLKNVQLVISFEASNSTDKSVDVADGYEKKLRDVGLTCKNVSLSTLDGAAVGLASRRYLDHEIEGWTVCGPHDTGRAIAWALGIGNKESKNPRAKALIKRNRGVASFFHRSTKFTKRLMSAQTKKGVPKGKELNAAVGGVTRWSADFDTVERNNILGECLDDVLEEALRGSSRTGVMATSWDDDNHDDLRDDVKEVVSDQYETSSTADEDERPATQSTIMTTRTKTPRPFTDVEWMVNAQMEAAMQPIMKLTLQTEGDVPVADMERYYVKRAVKALKQDALKVPRHKTGLVAPRKYDEVKWSDCDPAVTTFRDVAIEELERRHLRRSPPSAVVILMCLNPSLALDKILPPAQLTAARVVFERAWKQAASRLADLRPEPALPSPHKRRKAAVEDDDDDSMLDVNDEEPGDVGTSREDRTADVELAMFRNLTKADWAKYIIDDGVRGKRLDMAAMYANAKIRSEFPIATMLYESKGSAQVTEAHEERVFRFAKLTKTPQRSTLSPVLLKAFVIIRHNFPVWEMLYGKIDFDHLYDLFKQTSNTTGEHDNPGGETDEDGDNSGVEEDGDDGGA